MDKLKGFAIFSIDLAPIILFHFHSGLRVQIVAPLLPLEQQLNETSDVPAFVFVDFAGNIEEILSDVSPAVAAANQPATGAPVVTPAQPMATVEVVADITSIADADGLADPLGTGFAYQWQLDGVDIVKDPRAVWSRLGYLPQDFGFYPSLSGAQMLDFLLRLKGVDAPQGRKRLVDELLERVNLADAAKRKDRKVVRG